MNHSCERARFFDERTGTFRYKHTGSGIIRDTLLAIGKRFGETAASKAKDIAKRAAKVAVEKTGEKIGEKNCGKGGEYALNIRSEMFRLPRYLEKKGVQRFQLDTPIRQRPDLG